MDGDLLESSLLMLKRKRTSLIHSQGGAKNSIYLPHKICSTMNVHLNFKANNSSQIGRHFFVMFRKFSEQA